MPQTLEQLREIIRTELLRTHAKLPFPLDLNTLFTLKTGGFIAFGTTTLSSGVATVTDHRIRASSTALATYTSPGGTTGTHVKAVCTAGAMTITAIDTAGATVTTDTSAITYLIIL